MKRLVVMAVAAGAAVAAVAMPTKKELQKAQEMVSDVTAADVKALKAKTKTPAEVAVRHMELAGQAGSEAEKYLLLQGAFKLYAKAGDYDAAANVIEKLQAEISDYDPEVTVELCGAEFIRKMRENAPRLYAIKENARRIVFYRKQLPIREAAVKKNPRDQQAQRKLAECHAELGDWPKALGVFVKAGGEFKKMAEGEASGKIPAQELGDFWWDYETKSDTQVYKLHAAELYRKALADDSFKGLARTRAEQRAKEVEASGIDLPQVIAGGVAQTVEAALAHRWSFTKDFIDSIGKAEAKKRGQSVKVDNGHCVVQNGGIYVGDVLLNVGVPSTFEMWYTHAVESADSFVLQADQIAIRSEKEKFVLQWKMWAKKHDMVRFLPGHKLYFAITYDGQNITAYACDTDGDKKLYVVSPVNEGYCYDRKVLYLGGSHPKPGEIQYHNGTSGKYDEVRIWRVCKSKEDIEASIKAGPDQVITPKAQPASVVDKVVTSGKAPTPKCKMVNGRPAPLKFELAKGVDLELEGCPAGKFTMGYAAGMWNDDGKAAPKHEVTITRPFWIGKFQVTRGQAKSLGLSMIDWHLEVLGALDEKGGDTCSAVMTFDNINAFCRKLTEKFAAEIPTGYVFRLASNAEWEYASKAGDYSKKNPAMLYSGHKESQYILALYDKLELLKKKSIEWKADHCQLPSFPVGLKRPNSWGVFDMLGNHPEVTLDRIPKKAPDVLVYGNGGELGRIQSMTHAKQETDPLMYYESDWNLLVRGRWNTCLVMEGIPANRIQYVGGHGYAFRVCLGPDLVAEKKAKNAK